MISDESKSGHYKCVHVGTQFECVSSDCAGRARQFKLRGKIWTDGYCFTLRAILLSLTPLSQDVLCRIQGGILLSDKNSECEREI